VIGDGVLRCDICGDPIPPDEFVGLERLDDNRTVVVKVGAQVGDIITAPIWVHVGCLDVGKRIGQLAIGTDS
jgi:hypothetical protein